MGFKNISVLKTIAITLSVYFIILTLIPCADEILSDNYTTYISNQNDRNTHTSDIDLCSPFCTCNCCGSGIFCEHITFYETISIVLTELKFYFRLPPVADILITFWRPPKISEL